jgi:hypothetical protein
VGKFPEAPAAPVRGLRFLDDGWSLRGRIPHHLAAASSAGGAPGSPPSATISSLSGKLRRGRLPRHQLSYEQLFPIHVLESLLTGRESERTVARVFPGPYPGADVRMV